MTQPDGEKELVLGNKQLISLFFVVVALCGVFFAMGYMIGRNTSKPSSAPLESNAAPVTASPAPQTQQSEPPRETAQPDPPKATAGTGEAPPSPEAAAPAPVPSTQTQAARDMPPASVPEAGAT